MVKSTGSKRVAILSLLVIVLLPLLTEAFIHHPGMYGGHNSNSESSGTKAAPKTQAEKLKDPWLWVSIVAFSACMIWCLNTSFEGRWR